MTLEKLSEAHTLEISEEQAKDTKSSGSANAVLSQLPEIPQRKMCFNCGWAQDSKVGCPA